MCVDLTLHSVHSWRCSRRGNEFGVLLHSRQVRHMSIETTCPLAMTGINLLLYCISFINLIDSKYFICWICPKFWDCAMSALSGSLARGGGALPGNFAIRYQSPITTAPSRTSTATSESFEQWFGRARQVMVLIFWERYQRIWLEGWVASSVVISVPYWAKIILLLLCC